MFIIPKYIWWECFFVVVPIPLYKFCALSAYAAVDLVVSMECLGCSVTPVKRETAIPSAVHLHFFFTVEQNCVERILCRAVVDGQKRRANNAM